MLFSKPQITEILKGTRTWTIRPIVDDEICPYKVGKSYAIQSRFGGAGIARIKITEVRPEQLSALDLDESEYEELEPNSPVWVIRFRLDREEEPRLLAPAGRAGDGHGYTSQTSQAMREEPEAVDKATQGEFALRAGQMDAARKQKEWAERSLADRLSDLERGMDWRSRSEFERRIAAEVAKQAKRAA